MKRYCHMNGAMIEEAGSFGGDWCKYSDVEKLIELNKEMLEALKCAKMYLDEDTTADISDYECFFKPVNTAIKKAEQFNE